MQATRHHAVRLEFLTIAWNVAEAVVALVAAMAAASIALLGFGLDSVIEVFAARVVLWQLRSGGQHKEERALKLIGVSFFALAAYVGARAMSSAPTPRTAMRTLACA